MPTSVLGRWGIAALAGVVCALAAPLAAAAQAVEVRGVREATLGWAPAAGPVVAYGVWIAREGEAFSATPNLWTGVPWARLSGEWGERWVMQVAAFDASGRQGPLSPISDPIHFRRGEPAPRDFDGDGRSEILLEDASGAFLSALTTDGSDVLDANLVAALDGVPSVLVATGDLDGDRAADLILRRRLDGAVLVSLGAGPAAQQPLVWLADLPFSWDVAAVADLDGNGRDDVVVRDLSTRALELWRTDGARVVSRESLPAVELPWEALGAPDLDGNGRHDLLWREIATGRVVAWLMRGAWVLSEVDLGAAADLRFVGAGDLDGDGTDDLVWHDPRGRTLFWGVSQAQVVARIPLVMPAGWIPGALGDHDGDHVEEVLWWNPAAGATALVLRPTGATPISQDPGWLLVGR